MKPELQTAIEDQYNLKIRTCMAGPRQFVAETYILGDEEGKQYFCKLVNKPLVIRGIVSALPLVTYIHDQGIDRICYPIKGTDGLYTFSSGTLIVLYNYIPKAMQSFDYDVSALGKLIARIHALPSPKINDVPVEDYTLPHQALFEEMLELFLSSKSSDSAIQACQAVLRPYESEIRVYKKEFHRLAGLCKEMGTAQVITHGDAPGNVLVRSPQDIYLIDWDDAMLAPAEQDIWTLAHIPEFVESYRSVRADFTINANLSCFYTLKRYLLDIMDYLFEILKEDADEDYRLKNVKKLDHELSDQSWKHRLQEVKANMH